MALQFFPNRYGHAFLPISRHKVSITAGNQTMNAVGESCAGIGRLHLTTGIGTSKTISAGGGGRILWTSGTTQTFSNGSTNLRVGIQDVDGATGLEDGTHDVFGDLTGGTDTIAASTVIDTDMESGTKTIAHGDTIAIVIEMTARGGADSVTAAIDNSIPSLLPYGTSDVGAGPTKSALVLPMFTIVFDDGTIGWLGEDSFAWTVAANTAFNSGSTPDEYCQLVQYPWDFEAAAIVMYLNAIASTDDFEAILYSDPLGTPSVVETITVDVSTTFANNGGSCFIHLPFTTLRSITRNTRYGIAIRPTTANSVQLMQLSLGGAALRAVLPLGTNVSLGTRTNQSGAFSENTALVPVFGLVPASLHESSGSGGGTRGYVG